MRTWFWMVGLAWLGACEPEADEAEPTWFTTCGDPACQGYTGPFDGVDLCTTEAAGDPCTVVGDECDPEDSCNARLVCATEDPRDPVVGCPVSLRAAKRDVAYLDQAALQAAAQQALTTRLATWRYRRESDGAKPHLGFLIDDMPQSPAVAGTGDRVDLYGYTSLALAAVQVQQAQIDVLQAEVAALRAELEARR